MVLERKTVLKKLKFVCIDMFNFIIFLKKMGRVWGTEDYIYIYIKKTRKMRSLREMLSMRYNWYNRETRCNGWWLKNR